MYTLPKEPDRADKALYEQLSTGLERSKAKQRQDYDSPENPRLGRLPNTTGLRRISDSPAGRCEALMATRPMDTKSCTLVVMRAQVEFDLGLKYLIYLDFRGPKLVQYFTINTLGQFRASKSLLSLSGAYTADERVIQVEGIDYAGLVRRMIAYEIYQTRAPDPSEKLENMKAHFLRLKQEDGWKLARPAMAISVRCLLLRGHISVTLRRDYETGYFTLDKALNILTWGRSTWLNVHTDLRGAIFSDTFYAAVFRVVVQAYQQAFVVSNGRNHRFQLPGLLQRAEALIAYARSLHGKEIPGQERPGFITTFVEYPEAQGHFTKGWCLAEYAKKGLCKDDNDQMSHRRRAFESFLTAADLYYVDDERHAECLNSALNMLFDMKAPLRETLPVMERMRLATPGIKFIWEYSDRMRGGLDETLQHVASFEADVREGMKGNKPGYDLDDIVMPPWLLS
ncbi:hypothetical protein BV25DRAFT_1600358 [Artomyces pyxidatus]|uniref:Uncharacterized protein n=1 Tax=Artomyces pyxidatus TaxID=48021 RepID=A0ACB8TAL5_9AGAM|nr:hypothetical protein BV25DRAFT_1600358 [Artomyces pyxidatus]